MNNYSDVKNKAKNIKNKKELCALVDEVDALFMSNIQQIVMTDDDWRDFTILVANLERTLSDSLFPIAETHKCEGLGCAFKSACGRYLRPEAENQQWASFYALAGDDCSEFEVVEGLPNV